MKLTSRSFSDRSPIPLKYAHAGVNGGRNISIPLMWSGAPRDTKSFALSMVDLHPIARQWVHWLVIDIPATVNTLAEGVSLTSMPDGAIELKNTYGADGYGGPQPPKGSGSHDYELTLYALSVERVLLKPETTLPQYSSALQGKVLATATLVGTFER